MTRHSFSFTGNAKEYFGIWIVNLFLSIITLGIYTAWAKVRRVRYFYGNTHLDGHNFEYHANPKSILIGRIIVLGLLLVMNVLSAITPFALLLLVPYLIAFPWIINKSMQFNARVTSYRNIRFNFAGSYWRAAVVFILVPLTFFLLLGGSLTLLAQGAGLLERGLDAGTENTGLVIMSGVFVLALAFVAFFIFVPLMSKLVSNFIGNNLSYGTAEFATNVKFKAVLGNFFITFLFALVVGAVFAIVGNLVGSIAGSAGLFEMLGRPQGSDASKDAIVGSLVFSAIGGYAATFLAFVFYRAGVRNIAYSATILDAEHEFGSTLDRMKYSWILFTNLLATIATIGLLRPWAAIRTWRYLAENTHVLAMSNLDNFVEDRAIEGSAASAEFMDIEGIDFGL